jgi:hypothetical protein
MRTFKKKDFKKVVIDSDYIDEFVDDNGGIISGDERYNKGVDVKTGPINMPGDEKGLALTTNKHAANAIQPRNWWWSMTYGQGRGTGTGSSNPVASNLGESSIAEERMRNMVEDILSKKNNNTDIIKKDNLSKTAKIESSISDKMAKEIEKAIAKVDSSMTDTDFAIAVAYILKADYGSHNIMPFMKALHKELGIK